MSKRKKHNDLWDTRDGVIGFGEITLFDTEGWSEKDIALVEWAHPKDAHKVAKQISRKYEVKQDKRYKQSGNDALLAMFRESLKRLDEVDLRAFIIDEDGVTEIDPDTDKPL